MALPFLFKSFFNASFLFLILSIGDYLGLESSRGIVNQELR